ncbi:hypothetical protein RBH20_21095 [Haloarcula sp. H-GB4]|uniref:hypothetical protein n=1 Tax=Haloarcula sp. H-GB4 TaxID=3069755 RepID=UPI0027AFC395|nr:hypothetical protein [Haloarcula sp. H-GB4]MDQ2075020.1 hypothetical protein [Haloarcula sp. H-GB4]
MSEGKYTLWWLSLLGLYVGLSAKNIRKERDNPKNASQAMIPIIPNTPVLSDARAMAAETIQITEGRDRLIHASGMVEDCQRII